ncbi:2-oxoacid:ferredoxin oxidoreductase, gamma subunit [Desulfitobacterium dichloroeliminans LMG P-21439]|uniref:2-oxoacid:ferredoxin oxidoreductase, gamma subunit n=1 Tax=Desulfitobacterium dichloroeliminans (strain LMG P-21439 / DCA1) TaxID=871963 RepID=L0F890_DESDL|nr:2-oxoacid:acceptor oxidoreductase family protein [Desulfitobacterium dichloroeliminans]AGA69255.1 2-oxoacid:ferredoxin oxidoreductase, gamma subunit [Desulfitobacterium dichloroeliminans LMG P-21439]
MVEVKLLGRFGQPVGKITRAMGKQLMTEGKHVQVFDGFGAFRPGNLTNSTLRVADEVIIERSENETTPDVIVVLDNSLFAVSDVTKGLKPKGKVIALGVTKDVLGEKAQDVTFIAVDPSFKGGADCEDELIKVLKQHSVL